MPPLTNLLLFLAIIKLSTVEKLTIYISIHFPKNKNFPQIKTGLQQNHTAVNLFLLNR